MIVLGDWELLSRAIVERGERVSEGEWGKRASAPKDDDEIGGFGVDVEQRVWVDALGSKV